MNLSNTKPSIVTNGQTIILGSVTTGESSGAIIPIGNISSADTTVLPAGLTGVSEETGRGNLKMKIITDSATLTKAKPLIDAESDATNKLVLRA